MRAQWLILQQDTPDDFVIATGEQHSVREFVERAGAHLGYDIEWHGQGLDEQGVDRKSGKVLVKVDPRYFRPTEVETLLGDPSKAKAKLGWTPTTTFDELVREMVESDYSSAKRDSLVKLAGFQAYDYHE